MPPHRSAPLSPLAIPPGVVGVAALLLAGCAHTAYQPHPLAPAQTAAALDARSLDDPALHRFLAENLGRDPGAASSGSWNFETFAWVAFYHNATLEVARAQWASARAALRTAGERPNPTLGLTPGYSTNPGAGVSPWFPALTLDLPLETAGKRLHRTRAAAQAADAARQDLFAAAWKVRRELRRALFEAAAGPPRLELLRAQAARQQAIVRLLEQRLHAGAIAAPELATARLAALRAEADTAAAASQLPLARQRVANALGLPAAALADIPLPVPPSPPPLSPPQLAAARRQSLQTRPDILAALARYDAAESALALEVARQFPDLHLGPGYQWDQGQNKWTIGLTFELPVFHRNEGPIAEAEARRREAAAQFLATQAQALAEIDAAVAAQSAARAQLDLLRRIQRQLDEQRARAAARQHAGAADALETKSAMLETAAGALAVADAEAQAALADGQLEDALQIPFAHLAAIEPFPVPLLPSSP